MNELKLFSILADKISENYNPSIWGECNQINSTIAKFLSEKGFKIECIAGYVKCDNPTTVDLIYDPMHFWLKYNGKILDFASQQFKNSFQDYELNNKMNKDFFYGKCEHYIEVATHKIDNEWIDDLVYSWLNKESKDYIEDGLWK